MERIIQILVNRFIPFDVRKVMISDFKVAIFIYIKNNLSETVHRISICFKVKEDCPRYEWKDLRGDQIKTFKDLKLKSIEKKLHDIDLEEIYIMEDLNES